MSFATWFDRQSICTRIGMCFASLCLLTGILLLVILPSMTTNKRIEQDEWGLTFNKFTTDVSDIMTQGSHQLNVGDKLVKIKNTLQQSELLVSCLSYDKLQMTLQISLQYQYIQDQIKEKMFFDYGNEENFALFLEQVYRTSVFNTCGKYPAHDFPTRRSEIEAQFSTDMIVMVERMDLGVQVLFLQLKDYQLPQRLAEAIATKQLVEQDVSTERNARVSVLITAETRQFQANKTAAITLIRARNNARLILESAQKVAEATRFEWDERTNRLRELLTELSHASENVTVVNDLFLQHLRASVLSQGAELAISL